MDNSEAVGIAGASAATAPLSPAALAVVQPGQTPCQQAKALNQQELPADAVKAMANGLPERDSVWWATQSAQKVSNSAHVQDMEAIQAAQAWAQNPTPTTQQAAGLAAQKAGFQTPGAWAAQGAAWAGAGGGLTAQAVTGAVLLAAAQAGKPITAPSMSVPTVAKPAMSAPNAAAPEISVPKMAAEVANPQLAKLELPLIKTPTIEAPQAAAPGPDGLTLTPAERTEMAKNVEPYLDLGCDVGQGKNTWATG